MMPFQSSQRAVQQVHLPSCAHDIFLLRLAPFTYSCIPIGIIFSIFDRGDFSWAVIKFNFVLLVLFSIAFVGIIAPIYFFLKKSDTVVVIADDILTVKNENQELQYSIPSIDYFTLTRTSGSGPYFPTTRDLFIVNKTGDRIRIYSDDWSKTPKKSWDKASHNLAQITGKKVISEICIEDSEGQRLTKEELDAKIKKQFKNKMGYK